MTPAQVAAMFSVSTRTVNRWAKTGKLPSFRTPGGQFRFNRNVVEGFQLEADFEPEKASA